MLGLITPNQQWRTGRPSDRLSPRATQVTYLNHGPLGLIDNSPQINRFLSGPQPVRGEYQYTTPNAPSDADLAPYYGYLPVHQGRLQGLKDATDVSEQFWKTWFYRVGTVAASITIAAALYKGYQKWQER